MSPKRKAVDSNNDDPGSSYKKRRSSESTPEATEWPAPPEAMAKARDFLKRCATSRKKTVIAPDKDADGLCGGSIIFRTLVLLGHPKDDIIVHIVAKGANVHEELEREALAALRPGFVIIVDQGSRPSRVMVEGSEAEALIIDHHLSDTFPPDALVVTACHHEPVATASLLAYLICEKLHRSAATNYDWLACMGTIGDLGTTFKWEPPFPDMSETLKRYGKKTLNDAVSLVNAPRRTATYDVISAWNAVNSSATPAAILAPSPTSDRLLEARREVNLEVERCTHTPPKFSSDGRVALLRITSKAQVHPVIATRWAGHLKASALEIVMVANDGYLPGMVNFSCRVARVANTRAKGSGVEPPNIIEILKSYADRHQPSEGEPSLRERMGDNFARGHKQASGGIIGSELFEELCGLMEIGVKPLDASPRKKRVQAQKNTIDGYFAKAR